MSGIFGKLKAEIDKLGEPENRFSLRNLAVLNETLHKNQIVRDRTKDLVIETLRQVAEFMIYGDQHPQLGFFDFFLEKNMLHHFVNFVFQKSFKAVRIQVFQSLSILVENISAETSLFSLFSKDHINELITYKFDTSDDELFAYYISFLKSISMKLNERTIVFFFNPQTESFPLYTEAIKYFKHHDGLIRVAVRTLTLNVFRVNDESMRRFLLDKSIALYFLDLILHTRAMCCQLAHYRSLPATATGRRLDDFVADLVDYLGYMNDIYLLNIAPLSQILSEHILRFLFLSLLVECLLDPIDGPPQENRVPPLLCCYLLAQVFLTYTNPPLVNTLGAFLLHPNPREHIPNPVSIFPQYSELPDTEPYRNRYRRTLFSLLASDSDAHVLATLCAVYSVLKNPSTSKPLLEASGLLPQRLSKAKKLLAELTSPERRNDSPSKTPTNLGNAGSLFGEDEPEKESLFDEHEEPEESTPTPWLRALLLVLTRHRAFSLVTLQLTAMVMKVLVWSADATAPLPGELRDQLEAAYQDALKGVKTLVQAPDATTPNLQVLSLFERELSVLKTEINFDKLVSDFSELIGIVGTRADLSRRLPMNDNEHVRKAVQTLVVLRDLRIILLGSRDAAAQAPGQTVLRVGDVLALSEKQLWYHCRVFGAASQNLSRLFAVVDTQAVLIEPIAAPEGQRPSSGHVRWVMQIDSAITKIETLGSGTKVLQLTHPFAPGKDIIFDKDYMYETVKEEVNQMRRVARQRRLFQLAGVLGIDEALLLSAPDALAGE